MSIGLRLACTSFRVMRSSSASVRSLGAQRTPPLAPPKGTSTTAVFHVVKLARLLGEHVSSLIKDMPMNRKLY